MTTYDIDPVRRIKLRTNATRRFLLVSVYDRRAKVETTTDDENIAGLLVARYRAQYPIPAGRGYYLLLDQSGRGGD